MSCCASCAHGAPCESRPRWGQRAIAAQLGQVDDPIDPWANLPSWPGGTLPTAPGGLPSAPVVTEEQCRAREDAARNKGRAEESAKVWKAALVSSVVSLAVGYAFSKVMK